MNNIIEYFNNNAFVAFIISLVLSTIITLLINSHERKQNRKEVSKSRLREERLNRGEFRIDRYIKGEFNDNLNLIYTDYEKKKKGNNDFDCIYNKKILEDKYIESIYLPLKNIGKIEISELYISVSDKDNCILIEKERIQKAYELKYPNYVIWYYNKILPGEKILIELYYYTGSKIFSPLTSELNIFYRDGFDNFYQQPIFLGEERVEGPYVVSAKEYQEATSQLI